jgi:hypothetical protein
MRRLAALALTCAVAGCSAAGGGSVAGPPVGPSTASKTTVAKLGKNGNQGDFTVSGRYILLGGQRFFVKGMVYAPTPIGKRVSDPPMLDDFLRNADSAIWSRDLPLLRAMGVNAIHVYNVVPPPYDSATGPIDNFLKAAWNNGDHPIYVIMSIYFQGDKLLNQGAVNALAGQYHDLDAKYAKYPAVMGTAIGNELGALNFITNKKWWDGFNTIAAAAKKGFADGGNPNKIVTTSEADGNIGAVKYGTQYNAKVDVWGVNVYRGRTFTNLYDQIHRDTTKPVMLTEYGATAARHTLLTNTYSWSTGDPGGHCSPDKPQGQLLASDVEELPDSGNPNMSFLVDLVKNNAELLYSGFKDDGVVSGGFYFEWTDEWWKDQDGDPSVHGGNVAFNPGYPSCNEDSGWYGLNSVAKGGDLDVLTPRPTFTALKDTWASEP